MRPLTSLSRRLTRCAAAALAVASPLAACSDDARLPSEPGSDSRLASADVACDADNGGITLPAGFCATVFADELGPARHIAVNPGGLVFVAINDARDGTPGGLVALRDADGDGRAEHRTRFGASGGNGVAWHGDWLYFAPNDRVERYDIDRETLLPRGAPEVVVSGLPDTGDHVSKTIVIDRRGRMYLNIGSASNSCQVENRVLHSPGMDPCPELAVRAGVWRFDAERTGQTQGDGVHWGRGLRNMVALALRGQPGSLWGVQHGRDELHENWPEHFTEQDQTDLPSEELVRIDRNADNGWPFCFHDWRQGKKVLAPEYGGDGAITRGCERYLRPALAFPGHWAPNGLLFYTGEMFPERYRGGAFIAFHGSHDRLVGGQRGYNVVFVPFGPAGPRGEWEVFADGFIQSDGPLPASAKHRPTGVAQGPDGALYISDDAGGRVWRVVYTGE